MKGIECRTCLKQQWKQGTCLKQQLKHQEIALGLYKVYNKDNITTSLTLFWCLYRLVCSRFLDLRGSLGNVKKNRLEKLVSPVKRSTLLHVSTLQNFARRHFFDVNEVSIVFSWEIDIRTGESIGKGLIKKAL